MLRSRSAVPPGPLRRMNAAEKETPRPRQCKHTRGPPQTHVWSVSEAQAAAAARWSGPTLWCPLASLATPLLIIITHQSYFSTRYSSGLNKTSLYRTPTCKTRRRPPRQHKRQVVAIPYRVGLSTACSFGREHLTAAFLTLFLCPCRRLKLWVLRVA